MFPNTFKSISMKIKLKYIDELEERGLKPEDLTTDAQNGIEQIEALIEQLEAAEKDNKPTEAIEKKIISLDKWITYEIYDMDVEGDDDEPDGNEAVGLECEAELVALSESGINEISSADLKTRAPKCYGIIFQTYNKGEENGIETSHFTLLEDKSTPETFKLTKK